MHKHLCDIGEHEYSCSEPCVCICGYRMDGRDHSANSSCVGVLHISSHNLRGPSKLRRSKLALLNYLTEFPIADAGAAMFRVAPLPAFVFGVTTFTTSTARQFKGST